MYTTSMRTFIMFDNIYWIDLVRSRLKQQVKYTIYDYMGYI